MIQGGIGGGMEFGKIIIFVLIKSKMDGKNGMTRDKIMEVGYPNGEHDSKRNRRWSHKKFFVYVPEWIESSEIPKKESFIHIVSIKIKGVYVGGGYCLSVKMPNGFTRTMSSDEIFLSELDAKKSKKSDDHIQNYFSVLRSNIERSQGWNEKYLLDSRARIKVCKELLKKIKDL